MSDTGYAGRGPDAIRAPDPAADPVLCSPFEMPTRHWPLDRTGIAKRDSTPVPGRRPSQWLNPLPEPKGAAAQGELPTADIKRNVLVNDIRAKVDEWREDGWPGVTSKTLQLLEHWSSDQSRHFRPFFAQREAIETLIWLREKAQRSTNERSRLEQESRARNEDLVRHCVKMATGTGKTVVMALLIAWQAINAAETTRYRNLMHGQRFLILTPGLTIQRRLAVLKPSEPGNIYDEMGIVPQHLRRLLNGAAVEVANFQSFQRKDLTCTGFSRAGSDPKSARLARAGRGPEMETWEQVVQRRLKGLLQRGGRYGDLVVINDEAHHCYLPSDSGRGKKAEDRKSDERAAMWFTVIQTLRDMGQLGKHDPERGQSSPVYDFSATPFWIDTAARQIPEPFGWICSDFGLVDAIESGLVKVPRAPVEDDSEGSGDQSKPPVWRKLYENTKPAHKLDKPSQTEGAELPEPLRGALDAQVRSYCETADRWAAAKRSVPPVLIVVADTTRNADAIFEHIAGWSYKDDYGATRFQSGVWPELSNIANGELLDTPRTLVVHSRIGEDDDGTTAAGLDYMRNLSAKFSGTGSAKSSVEVLDHLRLVLNTVGKAGQPGEQIRCVVSVGMLSEGWDARNVTHIVGYRAFSTQLLCEQVTGRALRRADYENRREDGRYWPEHADIVGIPFEFMPSVDIKTVNGDGLEKAPTEVFSVVGRDGYRIRWPNVRAYRWSHPAARLDLDPAKISPWEQRHTDKIVSGTIIEALPPAEQALLCPADERIGTFDFRLAGRVVSEIKAGGNSTSHPLGFFPQAVKAVRSWRSHPDVKPPDLARGVQAEDMEAAARAVLGACRVDAAPGDGHHGWHAALDERHPMSDTSGISFETTLDLCPKTRRSELSHAACHSRLETRTAKVLDDHPEVDAWARNFRLGWTVPYYFQGIWRVYEPDFIARLSNGVNLIIECKGIEDDKARAAAEFVEESWIPCVAGTGSLPADLRVWRYEMIREADHLPGRIDDVLTAAPAPAERVQ